MQSFRAHPRVIVDFREMKKGRKKGNKNKKTKSRSRIAGRFAEGIKDSCQAECANIEQAEADIASRGSNKATSVITIGHTYS